MSNPWRPISELPEEYKVTERTLLLGYWDQTLKKWAWIAMGAYYTTYKEVRVFGTVQVNPAWAPATHFRLFDEESP